MAKSKTESNVDEFLTRIKAAPKDYEFQLIVEENKSQTKAQEKAYEENPPSTKQTFADCPIDLILPNGVYLDANEGIRRIDWDKPRQQIWTPRYQHLHYTDCTDQNFPQTY